MGGTATAEVRQTRSSTYVQLDPCRSCARLPGQPFRAVRTVRPPRLHRLLKMSARRSVQNQSHTELYHHLRQGEQDTHTVGTHKAQQNYYVV